MFPIKEIEKANRIVLEESGRKALQYSTTEGFNPLRKWIADRMNSTLDTSFELDNILITHGSQQGLDLMGKIFLNKVNIYYSYISKSNRNNMDIRKKKINCRYYRTYYRGD